MHAVVRNFIDLKNPQNSCHGSFITTSIIHYNGLFIIMENIKSVSPVFARVPAGMGVNTELKRLVPVFIMY